VWGCKRSSFWQRAIALSPNCLVASPNTPRRGLLPAEARDSERRDRSIERRTKGRGLLPSPTAYRLTGGKGIAELLCIRSGRGPAWPRPQSRQQGPSGESQCSYPVSGAARVSPSSHRSSDRVDHSPGRYSTSALAVRVEQNTPLSRRPTITLINPALRGERTVTPDPRVCGER
jgi:hypothetical protein